MSPPVNWYYNFLVSRPYLMISAIAVFSLACIIVSLTSNSLPDFSDPTLGFEARGTAIGKRLTAWQNLLQETGPNKQLVADPNDLIIYHDAYENAEFEISHKRKNRNRKRKNKRKKTKHQFKKKPTTSFEYNSNEIILAKSIHVSPPPPLFDDDENSEQHRIKSVSGLSPSEWNGDSGTFRDYEITNDTWSSVERLNRSEHFEYGRNTTSVDEDYHREKVQAKKSTWQTLKQALPPTSWNGVHIEGYFCDYPAKEYSHFVVERIGPNATDSLFNLNGLLAMCQLQDQITAVTSYENYCQKEMLTDNCCRPWSLANYATLLANKSSCFDLTNEDVVMLQNLLVTCYESYHSLMLSNDCSEYNRCMAPPECTRHNAVFNILHFLSDHNFIKLNNSIIYLKYAMIFVPVPHSVKILPLFHEWEKAELKNELLQVAAMDLGLENELFNELLLTDSWLVALGGFFVMACIWLYTASLFVTIMTCIAVLFSLGLAYFIYTVVFEMSFFPYMNLLAVVVIIGIGADSSFLFVKIWHCVLAERFTKSSTITTQSQSTSVETEHTETLQNLMALTLRHAALSMIVTSLTTAGAFYASYISSISSIKCFGVFAGTAVITNTFLMVTWLPASVSIMERMSTCTVFSKLHVQKLLLMFNKSLTKFCNFFETMIITAVMQYSAVWVVVFTSCGISGAVIVIYWPGLQLPESNHFQLFVSQHPFEIYNSKLKNEFWFEKSMSAYENFKMPLRFVWGIDYTIDDGDYTNPYSHGNLYYDNNFNISTKDAQVWLIDFCRHLRQQPFYQLTFGLLLPNCFIDNFVALMNRVCIDGMDQTDRTPCCDVSQFPYEPHVFDLCLPQIISSLYATRKFFVPSVAGPKFEAPSTTPPSPTSINSFAKISSLSNRNVEDESEESSEESFSNNTQLLQVSAIVNWTTSPPPKVKAIVLEFESNVSYTTIYSDIKSFVETVDAWFQNELKTAPPSLQRGWFISELKFYDVQATLSHDTIVAITLAMLVSSIVLLLVTLNVLISLYAIITIVGSIFTTVAILILLGWRLNVLESVTVSSAIGLAVDFSLHYGIHYRLSPTSERIAATQFALSRIIGPTAMAAMTTGLAGIFMLASNVLPYIQIGIFLVVVMLVSWLYATIFLMSLLKIAGPQYGFLQFSYPKIKKRPSPNGIKFYERKPSHVVASEQLLTPSNSGICELINSETHELDSLTSSTIIRTISGTTECLQQIDIEQRPLNCTNRNMNRNGGGVGADPEIVPSQNDCDAAVIEIPVIEDANNYTRNLK